MVLLIVKIFIGRKNEGEKGVIFIDFLKSFKY